MPRTNFLVRRFVFASILTAAVIAAVLQPCRAQNPTPPHAFTVSGSRFLFDGKPYQVLSGDMHYARIPRAYWRDRFRKARAMGLNTITTYVFWNLHEPQPGLFDFEGQNDIAEYVREAQQEGLNVILRPGPYVCAEWELGGYPSWLLKDRTLLLRSDEPKYTAAVRSWFSRLGQEIQPLLLKNGGPIIAVQVENEYGSFGDDQAYLEGVKNQLIKAGMGDTVLYTSNPPRDMAKGSLPELPTVINFGTGGAEKGFAKFEQFRPEGPRMSGEYWAGWFDHWGALHYKGDTAKEVVEYRWMLEQGYSVNMYMFEGGTTFGWMNGANSDGTTYQPDTTSYDYDAPLDERGEPRESFNGFRQAIMDVTGKEPPPLPAQAARSTFPISPEMFSASLWSNLPAPVTSKTLLTFEDLDQSFGYVLYRTQLEKGVGGKLLLNGLHDYAQVYIDQKFVGSLDRRTGTYSLDIPAQAHASRLDILVENSGRVNFTKAIREERKGLTGNATLDGNELTSWEIYSLPMDDLTKLQFQSGPCTGPCFFRANLNVSLPADTYLDTRALHKGMVWLGSKPLGRVWSVGPQYSLYTPAPWLHVGGNTVTAFDLMGDPADKLSTTTEPIFGPTTAQRN